ncbi:MAG: hypothetical protein Q9166_004954 [cf. Caloplaca sp. 2 TL-2023]
MVGTPDGVFGTVSHELHRKRRAALDPFFAKSTVASSGDILYDKMEALNQTFEKKLAENKVVELRQAFLALTTDTLCGYAFDRSMNLLNDEQGAADWWRTIQTVAILTPLVKQFTWIFPLALKLPLILLRYLVPDLAKIMALRLDLYDQAQRAIDVGPIDHISKVSLPSGETKSGGQKEPNRITQEGFLVIVAGSETSARVLTAATYHLLANPETALRRLTDELAVVFVDQKSRVDLRVLEQLPWLTPVSMTLRDILLDPTIFSDPHKFAPERWLQDNPTLERMNQAYVPFGRGSRICVGINFAMAELYIFIACLFQRFELELYDTNRERDIDTVRDFFIGETSPESPGVRVKIVKAKGSANKT